MAKTITLIILRADRELWDGGPTKLRVTDMRDGLRVLKEADLQQGQSVRGIG